MPFGIGFGDLLLIIVIVVVVFGATKLPHLGDGLASALRISQERDVYRRRRLGAVHQQWTPSEWALVVAAVVLTAVLVGNAVMATASWR